jgi:hypothetical protein
MGSVIDEVRELLPSALFLCTIPPVELAVLHSHLLGDALVIPIRMEFAIASVDLREHFVNP